MLTSEAIVKKLYDGALEFRMDVRMKRYSKAVYAYEAARNIALFMELDEGHLAALFGSRQGEEPVVGLYDEELALKAQEQCIIRSQTMREITMAEKRRREEEWRKGFDTKQGADGKKISAAAERSRGSYAGNARGA